MFDSPKSEGPVKRRQWARTRGSSEGAQSCFSSQLSVALPEHRAQEGGHGEFAPAAMTGRPPSKRALRFVWPKSLRVDQMRGTSRIMEMTWVSRRQTGATFDFVSGDAGSSCRWRRIGDHIVYEGP